MADLPPCLGQLALLLLCPLAYVVARLWMQVRDLVSLRREAEAEGDRMQAEQLTEVVLMIARLQERQGQHAAHLERLDAEISDIDREGDLQHKQIQVLRKRQDKAQQDMIELGRQHVQLLDLVDPRPCEVRPTAKKDRPS